MNLITKAYNHKIRTQKGSRIRIEEPWEKFLVYAVEWNEDRLDFYLEDSLYFTFSNDRADNPDTWPFGKPHYFLINLAYGGGWGGTKGVDPAKLPLEYHIDYVRYYSRSDVHASKR